MTQEALRLGKITKSKQDGSREFISILALYCNLRIGITHHSGTHALGTRKNLPSVIVLVNVGFQRGPRSLVNR